MKFGALSYLNITTLKSPLCILIVKVLKVNAYRYINLNHTFIIIIQNDTAIRLHRKVVNHTHRHQSISQAHQIT